MNKMYKKIKTCEDAQDFYDSATMLTAKTNNVV